MTSLGRVATDCGCKGGFGHGMQVVNISNSSAATKFPWLQVLRWFSLVLMPPCFCMLWGERGMTPDVKPKLILYAECWTNCFDSRSMSQRLTKSQRPRNTAKFSQRENHDLSFSRRLVDCNLLPLYPACITHSCI